MARSDGETKSSDRSPRCPLAGKTNMIMLLFYDHICTGVANPTEISSHFPFYKRKIKEKGHITQHVAPQGAFIQGSS